MIGIISIILQLFYKTFFFLSSVFSSYLSTYSIKFQQHYQTIWRNSIPFGKTLYNLAKPYNLAKVRGFAKLYTIFPNRHIHSGILKRQKEESTNHSGEPLYAQNSLISSHSLILSPNRIKIPMASIIDSRLCRYVTTMTFTPGKNVYPLLPPLRRIYPTQFDIRQIALSA